MKNDILLSEHAGMHHPWYVPFKVGLERILAFFLLLTVLPLLGFMALIVKVSSPGPAFYRQIRVGRGGRPFPMYKVRTMHHNCEAATGPIWCRPDDHRVTRGGRFLRETHLDELPQLWNVVLGHMSLIGPRPERPELISRIEQSIPRYSERLQLRPGLTGLAQMRLPADFDLQGVRKKLAHDLYYVREVSPWLDLRIVLSTLLHLFGVVLNSLGKLMVNSDGKAVEHDTDMIELMKDEERRMRPTG